eukprot:gnl/Chilomastix_caulleri/6064.p1 GENE.gnl/Chilomastix_caulleri/6064~~gnl/Chilomastix_caulleri/6064.p1  ORF type:complete len:74 (-),score=5.47 gnl/Chilomastix_caulleri/6064:318-539(-)
MLQDELQEANRVINSMQRSRREFSSQMNYGIIKAMDVERADHKCELEDFTKIHSWNKAQYRRNWTLFICCDRK